MYSVPGGKFSTAIWKDRFVGKSDNLLCTASIVTVREALQLYVGMFKSDTKSP